MDNRQIRRYLPMLCHLPCTARRSRPVGYGLINSKNSFWFFKINKYFINLYTLYTYFISFIFSELLKFLFYMKFVQCVINFFLRFDANGDPGRIAAGVGVDCRVLTTSDSWFGLPAFPADFRYWFSRSWPWKCSSLFSFLLAISLWWKWQN